MTPLQIGGAGIVWNYQERTLADDIADAKRPVDTTPHVHFHSHGLGLHSHVHVHPSEHAHSSRTDLGRHDDA